MIQPLYSKVSTFILSAFILTGFFFTPLSSQEINPLYADGSVPVVRIEISPDSLDIILDPENSLSNHEFPALFIFDNGMQIDTVENVGFRLRGNTSRNSLRKSFKISFNTFIPGRKFYGMEKLNLNGEHNDPSVIRAKLAWDLFKYMQVPSPRANHVAVYINSVYFGLFINVEHIDENFIDDRFGNNDGNLYKCLWPADLDYLGDDPELYKFESGDRRTYELKTNENTDDYSDLSNFIISLNTLSPQNFTDFEKNFNVDGYLRTLAMDVATGSWDNYWFLKNNYYLYHNTATGLFEFIPYDYDNSFGIDWVGQDWGNRDIYSWGHDSEVRPLVTKILAVQEYRDRFSFYLSKLLNGPFHPNTFFPRIDSIFTMISSFAEMDTIKEKDWGYTYADFLNSYEETIGGHVQYGLKPYITTRRNSALSQVISNNIFPVIKNVQYTPHVIALNQSFNVSAYIEDDDANLTVQVPNTFNGENRTPVTMYDDGLHNDGLAGDLIWGATVPGADVNGQLQFVVRAYDGTKNSYYPRNPQQDLLSVKVGFDIPKLFINEFMASNTTIIADEFGEFDDWLEIYNGDSIALSLADKYVTDNFSNPDKWNLPDTVLQPGEFLLIWADEDSSQGINHANFKLSAGGEELGIFREEDGVFVPIDTFSFGAMSTDISYGRTEDGGLVWQLFEVSTPGISNVLPTAINKQINTIPDQFLLEQNYPNPFNPKTTIKYHLPQNEEVEINIYNYLGQPISKLLAAKQSAGVYYVVWDASLFASGVYFYRLETKSGFTVTKKLILLK